MPNARSTKLAYRDNFISFEVESAVCETPNLEKQERICTKTLT